MTATQGKSEREANADTLTEIPDALIDDAQRARLIERAHAGEDVYAYLSGGFTWNVWDGELLDVQTGYLGVRVELPDVKGLLS